MKLATGRYEVRVTELETGKVIASDNYYGYKTKKEAMRSINTWNTTNKYKAELVDTKR